jgi:hypothetical protein
MKFTFCYHSLASDWNHGTARFLRGVVSEFQAAYPQLSSVLYDRKTLDLQPIAETSDVIIVHEWNEAWLVNELGSLRNNVSSCLKDYLR